MMFKRRQFLATGATGLLGLWGLESSARPTTRPIAKANAGPGQARNLIFILLDGGPSHVDTFDLKPGGYTPDFIGVEDLGGGFLWPSGIMPKLARRTDRFSVLRSLSAVEAVHTRAVYHLLTAHRQNSALMEEIPHFAATLSYMLASQRKPGAALPTVMASGFLPAQNGFLPLDHKPLEVTADGSIPFLEHWHYGGDERLALLDDLIELTDVHRDARGEYAQHYGKARAMMNDEDLKDLLGYGLEIDDYSPSAEFMRQCEAAVRVLAADKGTRVFQLTLGGWDHHDQIYAPGDYGLAGLSQAFDNGFAYLLDALEGQPALDGEAGTLLDQTLIVAAGEFGRTVGRLNSSDGRDHYPYVSPALLAGGGVKSGRVIGSTSADGGYIADPGWSRNRYIGVNDLIATTFSAMGLDWTERFENTPSGRLFEAVDTALTGPVYPIEELFV